MNIYFNHQIETVAKNCSLQTVLSQRAIAIPFAIALNQTFVPKSQYLHTILEEGDRIEIITPMQGG